MRACNLFHGRKCSRHIGRRGDISLSDLRQVGRRLQEGDGGGAQLSVDWLWGGIKQIKAKTVVFGASDAPLSGKELDAVPPVLKEAAYGIGCTTWEVFRSVVLPYTRVGVIGGVMLGLGRALGETMAVTFVIGNAHKISASILHPGTTISAAIANEFTEAVGDLYTSALIALGLILFVITFIVLAMARYMLLRIERRIG
jgi:hypothetical protein